jgi:ABC-type transport system substrate-binding protein
LGLPVQAQSPVTWSFAIIGFNYKTPPFNLPTARRAAALAIDRTEITSRSSMASSLVPPGCIGYNSSVRVPGWDQQMARELLAQAGIRPSDLGEISVGGSSTNRRQLDSLAAQLRSVGFNATVREGQDARAIFASKVWYISTRTDACAQRNLLEVLVHSRGSLNQSFLGYSNAAIDALIDQGVAAADQAAKSRFFGQAEQRMLDEAVLVPISWNPPPWKFAVSSTASEAGVTVRSRDVILNAGSADVALTIENGTDTALSIFITLGAAAATDDTNRSYEVSLSATRMADTVAPRASISGTLRFNGVPISVRKLLVTLPDMRVGDRLVTLTVDVSPP